MLGGLYKFVLNNFLKHVVLRRTILEEISEDFREKENLCD